MLFFLLLFLYDYEYSILNSSMARKPRKNTSRVVQQHSVNTDSKIHSGAYDYEYIILLKRVNTIDINSDISFKIF